MGNWSERRRTPPGVRELKPEVVVLNFGDLSRRTPPGVRELKLVRGSIHALPRVSHPSRGA